MRYTRTDACESRAFLRRLRSGLRLKAKGLVDCALLQKLPTLAGNRHTGIEVRIGVCSPDCTLPAMLRVDVTTVTSAAVATRTAVT